MLPSRTCKIFSGISILILLLFVQAVCVSAPVQAANPTVKVSNVYSATVGSTAEVTVSVENPSGMAGFQFELTYDPEIIIAKGTTKGPDLPGSAPIVNMSNAANGSIRVAWMDLSPVSDSMAVCHITFEVLAEGKTDLELNKLELVDLDGSMSARAENGSISTQADSAPDPDPDPKPDPKPDPDPVFSISTSQNLPHAQMNRSYSVTLNAANGSRPYTWELKSGDLPQGLELEKKDGKISGTPEKSGRHNFTLKVTDQENKTAEKQFTLWVSDGSDPSTKLPDFDYSKYLTTDTVTFKNLSVIQGSMEVKLNPANLPHTMVVGRNTTAIELLGELYSEEDKIYINNTAHKGSGSKMVVLQNGTNDIPVRIVSGDKASRQYTLTVFRLP